MGDYFLVSQIREDSDPNLVGFTDDPDYENWSCCRTVKKGDRILVYVAVEGFTRLWRATGDAQEYEDSEWGKWFCSVELVGVLRKPLTYPEIRELYPDWRLAQNQMRANKIGMVHAKNSKNTAPELVRVIADAGGLVKKRARR